MWRKKTLIDSDLVYETKDLVNALNGIIPVLGEYGIKYNTDVLGTSNDWSLLNDNSVYVFNGLGKNAPALGNNTKGIIVNLGQKGLEAQFVFTPHQVMYKTEGQWQRLLTNDDYANIVNNYIKKTDTDNWQKQEIFREGRFTLVECPSGTNFGTFLRSSTVPVGFSIIRDNNAGNIINYMCIKESSSWVYCVGANGFAASGASQMVTARIINGEYSGLNYFDDKVAYEDNDLFNADGTLKFFLNADAGENFSTKVYNYIQANNKVTAFYVQNGTPGNPAKDSARGVILPSHDTLGDVILIPDSNGGQGTNGIYVGFTDFGLKSIKWRYLPDATEITAQVNGAISTAEAYSNRLVDNHALEGLGYSHRVYGAAGQSLGAALSKEVQKGQGSFTFWTSGSATNTPDLPTNVEFRGLFLSDTSKSGGEVLFIGNNGEFHTAVLNSENSTWTGIHHYYDMGYIDKNFVRVHPQLNGTSDFDKIFDAGDYTWSDIPKNGPTDISAFGNWGYMHVVASSFNGGAHNQTTQFVFSDVHSTVGRLDGSAIKAGESNIENPIGAMRTWSGSPSNWSPWRVIGDTDSGWQNLKSTDNRFVRYGTDGSTDDSQVGLIRNRNGMVTISLYFTIKTDIDSGNDGVIFAKVPDAWRPSTPILVRGQGSGSDSWTAVVHADGTISCARYTWGEGISKLPGSRWMNGTIVYPVD